MTDQPGGGAAWVQRAPRRVVEAHRPGQGSCNVLLLAEGGRVAVLVHALDDLRVEFDEPGVVALITALCDLLGERGRDRPRPCCACCPTAVRARPEP